MLAGFDWMEVVIVRDGEGSVTHDGIPDPEPITRGSVLVIMPDVSCNIVAQKSLTLTHVFLPTAFFQLLTVCQLTESVDGSTSTGSLPKLFYPVGSQVVELSGEDLAVVDRAADRLAQMTDQHHLLKYHNEALKQAFLVLAPVSKLLKRQDSDDFRVDADVSKRASLASMHMQHPMSRSVQKTRRIIIGHYREPLKLEQLAKRVNMSASTLQRCFINQTGKTPRAYRDGVRVQVMLNRLMDSDDPVGVIAADVGWAKTDNAVQVFRQAVGSTPTKFRKHFRSVGLR